MRMVILSIVSIFAENYLYRIGSMSGLMVNIDWKMNTTDKESQGQKIDLILST